MLEIKLTQGKFAMVDDEDFETLNNHKWFIKKDSNTCYAYRKQTTNNKRKTVYIHSIIMETPKGMQIDHIDGNGLNNCKSNLRVVTFRQNMQNRHVSKTSQYLGVSKFRNKWIAHIGINGKAKYLGIYIIEEDARDAYLNALCEINEICIN